MDISNERLTELVARSLDFDTLLGRLQDIDDSVCGVTQSGTQLAIDTPTVRVWADLSVIIGETA